MKIFKNLQLHERSNLKFILNGLKLDALILGSCLIVIGLSLLHEALQIFGIFAIVIFSFMFLAPVVDLLDLYELATRIRDRKQYDKEQNENIQLQYH